MKFFSKIQKYKMSKFQKILKEINSDNAHHNFSYEELKFLICELQNLEYQKKIQELKGKTISCHPDFLEKTMFEAVTYVGIEEIVFWMTKSFEDKIPYLILGVKMNIENFNEEYFLDVGVLERKKIVRNFLMSGYGYITPISKFVEIVNDNPFLLKSIFVYDKINWERYGIILNKI